MGFDGLNDAHNVAEVLPTLSEFFPPDTFFSNAGAWFSLVGRLLEVPTGTADNAAVYG